MADAGRGCHGRGGGDARGTHDFAAFQGSRQRYRRPTDADHVSRRASPAATSGRAARSITYEVRGDGFLRHMVRAIVGTLIEVGRGRKPAAWMSEVLESRERRRAGPDGAGRGAVSRRGRVRVGDL